MSTPVCHLTRHLWEVVKFLEGRTYTARAIFASSNTSITAIQVARTNDNAHTIMYLGTDDGYMLKVRNVVVCKSFRRLLSPILKCISFNIC